MRISPILCGAALALAALSGPVQAQPAPVTTAALAELCGAQATDPNFATAQGFCRGFLIGVGQYHAEVTKPGAGRPLFCLPDPTPTVESAQASFVTWARGNAQYAGDKAVDGLMRWAIASFPCPPAAPTRRPSSR